jgi:transposase
MPSELYRFFVGIDWGSQKHRIVVVDGRGTVVHERTIRHDATDIAAFAQWLLERAGGDAATVAVALETPRGALVDALLAAGVHVYALNPKQLDRFRDRYTVAGAKDDRRDALVLATSLVTDLAAFRRLDPEDARLVQLRELTRLEQDVDAELRRLSNRLREQLYRLAPGLVRLCPGADEPWLWTLVERAPTPAAAARLSRAAVARVLAEHRVRRLSADDVRAVLQAPAFPLAPGVVAAAEEHLALLLPRLRLAHEQAHTCAARITRLLAQMAEREEHRDVAILRSLPGVGRKIAATMLAEASRLLATRDYHALRAHGGSAPVTKQSGKQRLVLMRYACNPRLRHAFHCWAQVAIQRDALTRTHYDRLRARGRNYARALRGVVDRLLAILVAMLRTQTLYDPARRRAHANAA